MDARGKAEAAMKEKIERLKKELSTVRTGRANPHMLEGVLVEYYGTMTPLKQVAAISVPEARTLEIGGVTVTAWVEPRPAQRASLSRDPWVEPRRERSEQACRDLLVIQGEAMGTLD